MSTIEEAVALKDQGNKAFKDQNYPHALELYSQAIEKNDKDPVFYTNRAYVREAQSAVSIAG